MESTITEPALTDSERRILELNEAVVTEGLATFIDVGNALAVIRDKRLYRESHKSFRQYLVTKWPFGKSRAYSLIHEAEVATEVSKKLDIDLNASQAAEIARLPKDKQLEAVEEAASSVEGPLTTPAIKEAVARRLNGGSDPAEHQKKPAKKSPPREIVVTQRDKFDRIDDELADVESDETDPEQYAHYIIRLTYHVGVMKDYKKAHEAKCD